MHHLGDCPWCPSPAAGHPPAEGPVPAAPAPALPADSSGWELAVALQTTNSSPETGVKVWEMYVLKQISAPSQKPLIIIEFCIQCPLVEFQFNS